MLKDAFYKLCNIFYPKKGKKLSVTSCSFFPSLLGRFLHESFCNIRKKVNCFEYKMCKKCATDT